MTHVMNGVGDRAPRGLAVAVAELAEAAARLPAGAVERLAALAAA